MNRSPKPLPPPALWARALYRRERERIARKNWGANARVVLVRMLRRAMVDVDLVQVHRWSRAQQGRAYLWAWAFLNGREDLPPPAFLVTVHTVRCWSESDEAALAARIEALP
jgi:hypothetical protein